MRWIVALSILFVGTMSCAFAKAESFLAPGVGLRALGMGGAFVAVADDITAVYWNPAGLPQLHGLHVLASLPFTNSSSTFFTQFYGAGGAIGFVGMGGISATKTYLTGPVREEREMNQLGLGGQLTSFFRAGIAAKRYARTLGGTRTEGLGLDLGIIIEPEPVAAIALQLTDIGGVTLRSLAPDIPPFQAEMMVHIGARFRILNDHLRFGLGMDVTQGGNVSGFHFGMEGIIYEAFALRAGWNNGEITLGIGLGIKNLFDIEVMNVGNSWTVSTELVLFGRKS
ncbi:hypothetical protein HYR54_15430 [Candidatus Acetothermia bacterium]|nr:hypothetical protein [Candidatus Acetothermia bacterium]